MKSTATPAFDSLRQLAKAIPRAPSTLVRWMARTDFPIAKAPPWSAADADTLRAWATRELQENRNEETAVPPVKAKAPAGFWSFHAEHAAPDVPRDEAREPVDDWRRMPAPIVSDFEREVLAGTRRLKPAELVALVALFVRLRAHLAIDVTESLPRATVGQGVEEIGRRARAIVLDRLMWVKEVLDEGLLTDEA